MEDEFIEEMDSINSDQNQNDSDLNLENPDNDEMLQQIYNKLLGAEDGEDEESEADEEFDKDTEDISEIGTSDNPLIVDFTAFQQWIEIQGFATSQDIEMLIEEQNKSIFDKTLNEFNVSESLILIVLLVLVIKFMTESIERIWLRWK